MPSPIRASATGTAKGWHGPGAGARAVVESDACAPGRGIAGLDNQIPTRPKPTMKPIKFTPEETADIVAKLQDYFREELDTELGNLPAQMFLKFLSEEIGGYFYNRGLYDAQAVLSKQLEEISEAIYGLEQREARTK
jgi:uncharacterized protein (DUF2164 family)